MNSMVAECTTSKELFHGIRLSEFQCLFKFDYKRTGGGDVLNIILRDYDLELVWKVEISCLSKPTKYDERVPCCFWKYMELKKSEKEISAIIIFEGKHGNRSVYKFDPNFKRISLDGINCLQNESITVKMQIYHEDERIFSIIKDYDKFFEKSAGNYDVTFVFENEELKAHQFILSARSEVFEKMFDSEMQEKQTGRVEITDFERATFKLLINFIYSGKLDVDDPEDLKKLLLAAHKYAVESLVGICGYRLSKKLTIENTADILILANQIGENFLKSEALKFLNRNNEEIIASENFKMLKQYQKDLAIEVLENALKNKCTCKCNSTSN